ncbi:DUF4034 domain-containing protein [Asanoa sp. NPDC049573]|uniref:DUF4034 domain-containing protein n=1 Tax=Asanoa sp. NPDC049573 TaxID=3155396 RepID=UPI0034269F0E
MWPFSSSSRLTVDPTEGDPTARALGQALARHDWTAADAVLRSIPDADDRAYLLDRASAVPDLWPALGSWVAAAPGDPLPLTVRGAYAIGWAWEARTAARAKYVSKERFQEFFRRLRLAEDDLDAAIALDPDDVTARSFLVLSARGRQVPKDEAAARFEAVVSRYPHHRFAHEHRLQYLCHKWFGSDEEMFAFARTASAAAPAGNLLGALIPDAHVERSMEASAGDYWASPAVADELRAAAARSVFHASFTRRPGWVWAMNLFAYAFSMTGDRQAAAACFDALGDRVTEYPWTYDTVLARPEKAYAKHRQRATSAG